MKARTERDTFISHWKHSLGLEGAEKAWNEKQEWLKQQHGSAGFIVDIESYVSPVTGKVINSRRQRMDDLKRSNSRPWEGIQAEQAEANRRKAYEESRSDSKLFDSAAKAFYSMPEKKRRELTRG